ncbi:hypothetical protein Hypma_003366 [Hypsizygus marmoreus]|uniref:Uncharacterized protein n=1 Tax=Hypsizygus marmoreus TaxID=39966 RepID=A0A369J2D5_HYPMA|nr:hypothetical protein Hypma_003366 [Hypsizygus marmoreus]
MADRGKMTYTLKHQILDFRGPIGNLEFSSCGSWIAASVGSQLSLWDVQSGKLFHSHDGREPPIFVRWLPLDNAVYCMFRDGWLLMVRLDSKAQHITTKGFPTNPSESGALHESGLWLALCSGSATTIWHRPSLKEFGWTPLSTFNLPKYIIRDGEHIIAQHVFWANAQQVVICYKHHGIITELGTGQIPNLQSRQSQNFPHKCTEITFPFCLRHSTDRHISTGACSFCGVDGFRIAIAFLDKILVFEQQGASLRSVNTYTVGREECNPTACPLTFIHGGRHIFYGGLQEAVAGRMNGKRLQTFPHNENETGEDGISSVAGAHSPNGILRLVTARGGTINIWETAQLWPGVDAKGISTHSSLHLLKYVTVSTILGVIVTALAGVLLHLIM